MQIVGSGKLTGRLGNLRAMTHWRLLRHVMESPIVLHKHGGCASLPDSLTLLDGGALQQSVV